MNLLGEMLMKLIMYEFKKIISSKYIMAFFAVFLIANAIICYYDISPKEYEIPQVYLNSVYDFYSDDPELFQQEYENIQEFNDAQTRLYLEQMQAGNYSWQPDKLPNKYAPDGYTDAQLFNIVSDKIKYVSMYPELIEKVIQEAVAYINEYDSKEMTYDEFAYQYQLRVIQVYSALRSDVDIFFENAFGWDDYFAYDTVNIFIFAILIIIGTFIFTQEKSTGFLPILRSACKGKLHISVCKIATAIMTTVIVVSAFTLESWFIIGIVKGYSSHENAIQIFDEFMLAPINISIGEYFILDYFIKLLTFTSFVIVVLTVSVLVYNYILSYCIAVGYYGLNLLIYSFNNGSLYNAFGELNVITGTSVDTLFTRYKAIDIFGNVADLFFVYIIAHIAVITTLSIIIAMNINVTDKAWKPVIINRRCVIKSSNAHITSKYRSILSSEIFKALISSKNLVLIILLLVIKCCLSHSEIISCKYYGDDIYKEYMTVLSGENSEEKRMFISDERSKIDSILGDQDNMMLAYTSGEITLNDYTDYLDKYSYAYSHNGYLSLIEKHAAYIDRLAEEDSEAWFIYDTGWNILFGLDFDWTLYAAIIIICAGIYSIEFSQKTSIRGFVQIIRTTKYGRKRTFDKKLLTVTLITVIVAAVWSMIDIVNVVYQYELPHIDAPLKSIETFENIYGEWSIKDYIVCFYVLKLISAIILAYMVTSLSALIHTNITVMTLTIGYTLLPNLLASSGISVMEYCDYISFMRVTPMILKNIYAVIFLLVNILICSILLYKAERKWVKCY